MKIEKVNIKVTGDFEVVIKVDSGTISIGATGAIVDIELNGNLTYNVLSKVSSIGSIAIEYNMSGKICSIGSTSIEYNMSGKISSIGSIPIEYNMSGKISSIGSTSIVYNISGKVSSIGNKSVGYNMSGKVVSGNRVVVYNDIAFALKGGY